MKKIIVFFAFLYSSMYSPLGGVEPIEEQKHSVIILGGGVGALTAATYLARAGMTPLVITGPVIGGTITLSHAVQNWPGEITISGDVLSEKIYKQAQLNGALLVSEEVIAVDFLHRPFTITTKPLFTDGAQSIKKYKADACIIALGSYPNLLHVPGEEAYWTRGVYTCAVCDGTLYKDKVVAVVGGGDSALTETSYLSNLAKKVYLIVRGEKMRAVEKKRIQEVLERPNVEVLFESTIQEIKGDGDKLTHLLVENKRKKEKKEIPVSALFLAIGSKPNTELFRNQLQLDEKNYIVLKKNQQTSLQGVYAIGDVADPEFKQAISAAGDGAKAALQAQQFLAARFPLPSKKETALAASLADPEVIEISSSKQFHEQLRDAQGVVFVDFYSTRCGPCRTFKPLFESWARDFHGKILFLQVNADKVGDLFDTYDIHVVPTLVILDAKGNVIRKSSGTGEIAHIEKHLQRFKDKSQILAHDFD